MTTFFTSPVPSQSSQKTRKFRTLTSQFGDGYRQDAPDGLNFQIDTWALTFENLNATDAAIVTNFFDSVGSFTVFSWQAPGDATSKTWKMSPTGYTSQVISGLITTISVQIDQVF